MPVLASFLCSPWTHFMALPFLHNLCPFPFWLSFVSRELCTQQKLHYFCC